MWQARLRLIQSIIAARVVLFPDPVGPVISTRPLGLEASSCSTAGSLSSSRVAMVWGISRSTMAGPRRDSSRLMRTLTKGKAWEPSNSLSRWKASTWAGLSISRSQAWKPAASVTGQPVRSISPRSR